MCVVGVLQDKRRGGKADLKSIRAHDRERDTLGLVARKAKGTVFISFHSS